MWACEKSFVCALHCECMITMRNVEAQNIAKVVARGKGVSARSFGPIVTSPRCACIIVIDIRILESYISCSDVKSRNDFGFYLGKIDVARLVFEPRDLLTQ